MTMHMVGEGEQLRDPQSLVDRAARVFTDVFWNAEVPAERMTRDTVGAWDSLMQAVLILSLEQEFNVIIPDTAVVEMNSFAVAVEVLRELLVDPAGAAND